MNKKNYITNYITQKLTIKFTGKCSICNTFMYLESMQSDFYGKIGIKNEN